MRNTGTVAVCPSCIGMGFVFTNDEEEGCRRSVISCVFDGCSCAWTGARMGEAPCPECEGHGWVGTEAPTGSFARTFGRMEGL